ncbi:hypothetical protein ILUMI_02361 [Ignelater luminosus]|uniref:Transmembrane protein 26 n=1 Tax=Ignelater luminosus TaxID=2038154 RepID=A0A8K0GKW4_IGNLU|nr:hypothetical protein ILUMI_02361 [Ignelater luminosus]
MAKFVAAIKAVITRLVFAAHGFIAIWQVTIFKKNIFLWYLSSPILLLFFEGLFTLTIKENQEWKWFCPSVFLYLASVVPAIWLLELDKVERRLKTREETFNLTASAGANLKDLHNLIGVQIKLPEINLSTETWITLIEQFLMLILIIGRWMLPKGELTRDQLSQILLVYIGTAADIIEFFDSFKDDKVASEPILVILTLAIWTWSLMQFTVVLTATKSRKSRMSTTGTAVKPSKSCCNIDVWGIALNITLQDAPFLAFRLLIITHYKIISYMNVFFTCKNTLVILLQLYRLHVVYSESRKKPRKDNFELTSISIISKPDMYRGTDKMSPKRKREKKNKYPKEKHGRSPKRYEFDEDDDFSGSDDKDRKHRYYKLFHLLAFHFYKTSFFILGNHKIIVKILDILQEAPTPVHVTTAKDLNQKKVHRENSRGETKTKNSEKHKLQRSDVDTRGYKQNEVDAFSEESESDTRTERMEVWKGTPKKAEKKKSKDASMSASTISNTSSE